MFPAQEKASTKKFHMLNQNSIEAFGTCDEPKSSQKGQKDILGNTDA